MKSEDVKNMSDEQYAENMKEMVQNLLKVLDGHDSLFGMQALMTALGNVAIDCAPSQQDAINAIMGLSIGTIHCIERAYAEAEAEEHLEGEENASHDAPSRLQ